MTDQDTKPDDREPFAVYERPPEWDRPVQSTDADWLARYTFRCDPPTTVAARVALADAAPAEFRRDTGREPPHDLVAQVFAGLKRHYPVPADTTPPPTVVNVEDYDFGPPNEETCATCQRGTWDGLEALAARKELGCPNPECADSKGRKHTVPGFVKMTNDGETPEVYLWTTPAGAAALQSLPPPVRGRP